MTQLRHFFIDGQYLGTGPAADYAFRDERARKPWATAYFCPICGEVWARIAIDGQQYHVYSLPCIKHIPKWEFTVYGSVWMDNERQLTDSFPPAVLARELDIHLKHGELFYKEGL